MSLRWKNPLRLNAGRANGIISDVPMGSAIPKIIHQTYGPKPLPEAFELNRKNIQRMNPGWDYRLYHNEERRRFIEVQYGQDVLELYDAINPEYGAARADLFRYLLIYKEGGVYFDMKSTTSRPLDEVLKPEDLYLLSNWRSADADDFENWGMHKEVSHLEFGEFQQWFLVAAPGHPYLKAVIETVLENIRRYIFALHGSGAYAVLRTTGPVPYTLAIEPILAQEMHRIVDSRRDLGLVYSIFDNGTQRSHEKIFRHYTTHQTPLVKMGPFRTALSSGLQVAKWVYKGKRPPPQSTA